MAETFVARYYGRCAAGCGEPIRPGQDVQYVDDEVVHASCSDSHPPRRPERPACPSCHLVHAGDCF